MKGKVVFINGAGGFIGSHAVEYFVKAGYQVIASDIPGADLSIAESCGAKTVPCQLEDKDGLIKAMEGAEIVLNIAAIFDLTVPMEIMERVNHMGVRNMCEAAVKCGVSRFVQLSTVGVFGKPTKIPITEDDPKNPRLPYEISKWNGEQAAFEYFHQYNLPVIALRPTLVYGPRSKYGLANYLAAINLLYLEKRRKIPGIKSGPYVQQVHIEDVVRALEKLATDQRAVGKAFIIADDTPLTQREYFETLMEPFGIKFMPIIPYIKPLWRVGHRMTMIVLPRILKKLNSVMDELWQKHHQRLGLKPILKPTIDEGWLVYAGDDYIFDNSRLKSLGFELKYPDFRKGFKEVFQWYVQNKWLPGVV